MSTTAIKALLFDVFGTVVDWRSGIAAAGVEFGHRNGITGVDWERFALDWRALYQPAMERVRTGEIPFVPLDVLHRRNLDEVLRRHGISGVDEAEIDRLNRAWHRLDPWPDAIEGLTRLKRRYIVATHSNGNVALIVNMAKRAGLPWDVVLGAEVVRCYKPLPESYDRCCKLLGLPPEAVMMVAAHNGDLSAARARGLKTAFVLRPAEYGPGQTTDLVPEESWDCVAGDLVALATALGC